MHSSKGENTISYWLEFHNIRYKTQKIFDDCKFHERGRLRFDFYIPSKNLCIEYDGRQHFMPIKFSNSMSNEDVITEFETNKIKDKIKNEYCKENNINLLRIRYNENIEEKLTEYFSEDLTLFDL